MVELLDITPKVIKITWPDDKTKTIFMKTNFGLKIMESHFKEGYVIALSTEKQRENLKDAGLKFEIVFNSMDDYVRFYEEE